MLEDLFAPGEVIWKKKFGNDVSILKPGDICDAEYLKKFWDRNAELNVLSKASPKNISKGHQLFLSLSEVHDVSDKNSLRSEIITWGNQLFWDDKCDCSILDLVLASYRAFYNIDKQTEANLIQSSRLLFKRSALVGSLVTYLATAIGYTDFKFLQDLYHTCFLLDYSIDNEQMSSELIEALLKEQEASGEGVRTLSKDSSVEVFIQHPRASFDLALADCAGFINQPQTLRLIKSHHEKIDSSGFPKQLNSRELSDIEALMIFVSNFVTVEHLNYTESDGAGFIKNILGENSPKMKSILSQRLIGLISKTLDNLTAGHEKYQEVVGI